MRNLAAWTLALAFSTAVSALPVIPGAAGFGIETVAGRGGAVRTVTSLADGGPGTLREALEAAGPRTVIFAKSGSIRLRRDIDIAHPYLTVAGQTAPSPGIQVTGASIRIRTHDVLIQHMRLRPGGAAGGPDPQTRDAVSIVASSSADTYNVVLDHVSLAWSTDGLLDSWAAPRRWVRDVTIRNCILAEALRCPNAPHCLHPGGAHSMASLIGQGAKNVTMWRNLFVRNEYRNPRAGGRFTDIAIVNNVIYKPGPTHRGRIELDTTASSPITHAVVEGNVVITRDDAVSHKAVYVRGAGSISLYLADNRVIVPKRAGRPALYLPSDPWDSTPDGVLMLESPRTVANSRADRRPASAWPAGLPVLTRDIESTVVASAGARPADRDADDARIIQDVVHRGGPDYYDMPRDGGPHALAENRAVDGPPADPARDSDGDGYTDLEEWLHAKAAQLERVLAPGPALGSNDRNVAEVPVGIAHGLGERGVARGESRGLDRPRLR